VIKALIMRKSFQKVLLCSAIMFMAVPATGETLSEALMSAYAKNPRLQAERSRVREVDENYIQARAQGRLTTSLNGSIGQAWGATTANNFLGQPTSSSNFSTPRTGSVQAIQPLYQGGRVRALKRQAKASIFAAREGLRNTEQGIFNLVASAYVSVLRDEQAAVIRRRNVSVLARQQEAAQARFDVGEGTRTDIAQAKSRLAGAEIGLAQADAQLQSSRADYVRAVGYPPNDLQEVPVFILPQSLQTAMAIARENNPQLIASLFNEEAADAAIDVAKAASRPSLSLNGSANTSQGQAIGFGRSRQAQITANLTIPIFSGGLNRSRVRAAKEAHTRTTFETRDVEQAIDQTVSQIWAQLDASKRSLIQAERQVASAEVAFEGVELEQQIGTRSTLDVLNAEQELLMAQITVIDAKRAVDDSTFQLLTVLGVFDAEGLQLPVDLYDPNRNFEAVKYKGLNRVIDRYVPELVEEVAREVQDIPDDIIELYDNTLGLTGLPKAGHKIVKQLPDIADDVGVLAKDGVDSVTGHSDRFHLTEIPKVISAPLKEIGEIPGDLGQLYNQTLGKTLLPKIDNLPRIKTPPTKLPATPSSIPLASITAIPPQDIRPVGGITDPAANYPSRTRPVSFEENHKNVAVSPTLKNNPQVSTALPVTSKSAEKSGISKDLADFYNVTFGKLKLPIFGNKKKTPNSLSEKQIEEESPYN